MRFHKLFFAFLAATTMNVASDLTATSPAWKGAEVHFDARLEPASAGSSTLPGGVVVEDQRVHRVMTDRSQKKYFGYDLLVEPRNEPGTYSVRIAPLSLTSQALEPLRLAEASWEKLSLPAYPLIPAVHLGESLAIDLLVNPSTGQKVIDYISLRPAAVERAHDTIPARDISLADINLDLDEPHVLVNGTSAAEGRRAISGAAVWLYFSRPRPALSSPCFRMPNSDSVKPEKSTARRSSSKTVRQITALSAAAVSLRHPDDSTSTRFRTPAGAREEPTLTNRFSSAQPIGLSCWYATDRHTFGVNCASS